MEGLRAGEANNRCAGRISASVKVSWLSHSTRWNFKAFPPPRLEAINSCRLPRQPVADWGSSTGLGSTFLSLFPSLARFQRLLSKKMVDAASIKGEARNLYIKIAKPQKTAMPLGPALSSQVCFHPGNSLVRG